MADDGMLLNFSMPTGPLTAAPSFKGGPWRARRGAQLDFKRWQSKQSGDSVKSKDFTPSAPTKESRLVADDVAEFHLSRPAKRQRLGGDVDYVPQASSQNERTSTENRHASHHQRAPLKEVVSSLFTYNPQSTTQAQNENGEPSEEPVLPSNAPLTDEMETFVSLGLSVDLAGHLTKKMGLIAPTAIQKAAVTRLVREDTDAFIQAETGSGKTLAYCLPIIQRLMALSMEEKAVHRDSGLFAIILAPTRELSKQISAVLDSLLRCAHWIVAGTVIGGEKKKSEKARLRKGLNILVATPGRLADHLNHTEALNVSNVRWLVLDEGDRLMELGFENDIQKIISALNLRMRARKSSESLGAKLPAKRTTILCSATMKMDVQKLGEISLKDAAHIQGDPNELQSETSQREQSAFSAPTQLKQSYAIVPAKLRLVTLVSVLKRAFIRKGAVTKVIVFISCADSVDFHFSAFARADDEPEATSEAQNQEQERGKTLRRDVPAPTLTDLPTQAPSPVISTPENPVTAFRLHGSLQQAVRTSTLQAFTKSTAPAVLFCTDVASRGLDLPSVDLVVEYDPAFSKDEHLHRIGRTARAGREGRACVFLMPGEEEGYVEVLKSGRRDGGIGMKREGAEELLKKGFAPPKQTSGVVKTGGGSGREWEERATAWQLGVERWALADATVLERARRAFQSFIRAYATHVVTERQYFNIKALHLGHLAKAFGLRDKPGSINVPGMRPGASKKTDRRAGNVAGARGGKDKEEGEAPAMTDEQEAKRKMRMMSRAMGGASEFNLG